MRTQPSIEDLLRELAPQVLDRDKGFPAAVLELRSGRLWKRPAIESYLGRHPVGLRRLKTLSSQVGGRTSTALQQKKLRPAAMKSPRLS